MKPNSEESFQAQVVDLAKRNGWLVHAERPARKLKRDGSIGWATPIQGHTGFPDICLARGLRVIWCELKSEKGRVSGAQENWLFALKRAGQEVHIWRPSDWPTILEVLT